MLELYHHGSSVCAAKVRMYLHEKELEWTGHYIDILTGEQFDPAYMKLNPKAVVPTLVHDGTVICDSTIICEYIEDSFPSPKLRPSVPIDHARVLYWTKAVDEELHPACGFLTFLCCHRHIVHRLGPEGVQKFLDSTPALSVTADWHETKKSIVTLGFEAPGAKAKVRLYDLYLHKMEEALQKSDWLAGDRFSFADIAMTPYVNRLDMLTMSGMWQNGRLPKVEEWWTRIRERKSFQPELLNWVPEDLTQDLHNFGQQSWPEIANLLDIELKAD